MATCKYCGEEIEFRYVDGRCVPIHPGGGWHCGSWAESSHPHHLVHQWDDHDFTRLTHCPECGADVYFIRHNGGSVWVDKLGWPWPKHGCFDHPGEATHRFGEFSVKSSGLRDPKLGVVTKADSTSAEPAVIIRLNDSRRVSVILRHSGSMPSLLGALVIVSFEDGMLIEPSYGEVAFHSAVFLPSAVRGWMRCERCKGWIQAGHFEGNEDYCREHYGKPRASATPRPPAAKSANAETVHPRGPLDDLVAREAEKIVQKAWSVAASHKERKARLKAAKQEALRLARTLPPSIRGKVEHHFTAYKWALLLNAEPR